jgi:hypothetical protein
VLPFNNVSGDPDQESVAEGLTEDIITALSKHRSLLVIAKSSMFALKGTAIDVRRVGIDLGADYVVEGGVVRSGQHLRIRTRLVETEVGRHVWAERYDRSLQDVSEGPGRDHRGHCCTDRTRGRLLLSPAHGEDVSTGIQCVGLLSCWDVAILQVVR